MAGTIRKHIGAEIARQARDPRLATIYVETVELSPDLGLIRVGVRRRAPSTGADTAGDYCGRSARCPRGLRSVAFTGFAHAPNAGASLLLRSGQGSTARASRLSWPRFARTTDIDRPEGDPAPADAAPSEVVSAVSSPATRHRRREGSPASFRRGCGRVAERG